MAFKFINLPVLLVGMLLADAFAFEFMRHAAIMGKPKAFGLAKRSMLVGMSETTEEVCETVILHNYEPVYGHLLNGSYVEILQKNGYKFTKTYVQCVRDDRPSCHGVKDSMYISECVSVFENAEAMVRLLNTSGPFKMGVIRVPILCECRLRRQYRSFERPGVYEDDDEDAD